MTVLSDCTPGIPRCQKAALDLVKALDPSQTRVIDM